MGNSEKNQAQAATGAAQTSSLEKFFAFQERERELYKLWESSGIFAPQGATDKPVFNISMPPPNANGELHLGHAFGYTVMDILGRFHRLCGERVLLLPGKDHAGIQTQVVYEKKLKSEKVDYRALPSETLYRQCYDFCIDRAQYMRAQEKTLGLSADWSRELFTLDPRLTDIIYETFEKMWADGLIYRGNRIVNWSVFSQTAISDVEVEYKEQDGGLWYIRYPHAGDAGAAGGQHEIALPSGNKVRIGEHGLVTATTRPETMLGDTALAVHPDDERYKPYIGKEVIVPLIERRIRVVADRRVDPAYGTGVIKVTPAHDFVDYDIGQDHKLEIVQVIGKDGKMTDLAGAEFSGLSTLECREKAVARLSEAGLLLDTATIKHKVPIGERGKDVIEPLVSEQWFVAVDKPELSIKQRALEFLRAGKVKVYPARFQALFEQWLENLRDWNISRQIWWGHRLPVWYRGEGPSLEIYVGRKAPQGAGWRQETDTFDTWFSSGQWAFSTMAASGFLNMEQPDTADGFFPTNTMVMGRDILFFWACRMLLLTAYRLDDIPWRHIFFTGLIRDENGQKMSKSKGNGIEPNDIINRFGTDALRLAMVMGAAPGNDIILSERKIEGYSKFINKLWNAAKLLEMKLGGLPRLAAEAPPHLHLESSRWILGELDRVYRNVTDKLRAYEISIAADELYSFTWTVFCDWYLEMMKVLIDKGDRGNAAEVQYVATRCFRAILVMLHPFVPFLTEEIYQKLAFVKQGDMLAVSDWRMAAGESAGAGSLPLAMEVIGSIRSVKAALTIPHKQIRVALAHKFSPELTLLIRELGRVEFCPESEIPQELALRKPFSAGMLVCEVEGKERYRQRLEKEIAGNREIIGALEKKLSGAFAAQAKPDLVEKERERLSQTEKALAELIRELDLIVSA